VSITGRPVQNTTIDTTPMRRGMSDRRAVCWGAVGRPRATTTPNTTAAPTMAKQTSIGTVEVRVLRSHSRVALHPGRHAVLCA
jgi:hypothetical protein